MSRPVCAVPPGPRRRTGGRHPGTPTRPRPPAGRRRTVPGPGPCSGLAAGERGDLGVHRAELGLQVIHPAQRDRDRLRPGGRQPHPGAVGGQSGAHLRVAEPPGQAGHALVEQGGVDPLGPGGVLLGQVAVQLQQRPQLAHLLGRDSRQRHPPVSYQDAKATGIGLVGLGVPLGAAQVRSLGQQRRDPARCSSSTTNCHPVQPSTANITSWRPANRSSQCRSVSRQAGEIRPRRTCPVTVSR